MKIAILYICTGKYTVFWKDFYESAARLLFEGHQKTYFIFTDAEKIDFDEKSNIKKVYQEKLGWPFDTLMRFNMFLKAENDLKNFDYIFFFNANMLFVEKVGDELIDYENGTNLLAVKHPGYYKADCKDFPYERKKESTAYVPYGEGQYYFMGGLNGGKAYDYLTLIHSLDNNIKIDLDHNIIAQWHDESQLNRYLINKKVKVLSPEYGYPEGWNLPLKPKIIIRNKNKWGGHSQLRGIQSSNTQTLFNFFKGLVIKVFRILGGKK